MSYAIRLAAFMLFAAFAVSACTMESLVASAKPPLVTQADSFIKSGAPLIELWEYAKIHEMIDQGDFDVVVLQEDIPETDVAAFHEYAHKFDVEIKSADANPVLFMTSPYDRLGWTTLEEIAHAHRDVVTELNVDVAPVGLAWQRALEERPDLDMCDLEREHPSIHGTYVAINVVHAMVFGKSPVSLTYLPVAYNLSEEEGAFLQRIAWETVQDYQVQAQP